MRERRYKWFLEPLGNVAYSNEIIAKNIRNPEVGSQDVLCEDKKRHDLWQCLSGEVFKIWSSRKNFGKGFKVRVFCQEGNGQIREWYKKKKKKKGLSHAKF